MPESTPIEQAYQLIQSGQTDDARRALATILQANPKDAMAWALSARLAPDAERMAYALRQTVDRSDDNDLAQWAIHQLERVQTSGQMDSTPPPLLGISAAQGDVMRQMFRQEAQMPRRAPAAPEPSMPVKLAKTLPTADTRVKEEGGIWYAMRQVGGAVVIFGVLLIAAAVISQPLFDAIAKTGILPGWYGIVIILIGSALIGIGYAGKVY